MAPHSKKRKTESGNPSVTRTKGCWKVKLPGCYGAIPSRRLDDDIHDMSIIKLSDTFLPAAPAGVYEKSAFPFVSS